MNPIYSVLTPKTITYHDTREKAIEQGTREALNHKDTEKAIRVCRREKNQKETCVYLIRYSNAFGIVMTSLVRFR